MSKKVMIGIEGVARKVKKGYIGINGVAHKIKKAYVGINGVARPFWSTVEKWRLYGSLPDRATGTKYSYWTVGGSNSHYGICFGSTAGDNAAKTSAYDAQLTEVRPDTPSIATWAGTCATIAEYVLTTGGEATNVVMGYDENLTLVTAPSRSVGTRDACGVSAGHHAIFGGGYSWSNVVNAYDSDLVRTDGTLLNARGNFKTAGACVGIYGLIPGGSSGDDGNHTVYNTIDAFDSEMTRNNNVQLSAVRSEVASASDGKRALIGGGNLWWNDSTRVTNVDVVDDELVCSQIDPFTVGRYAYAGVCVEGHFLFAGGYIAGGSTATTEGYNIDLTHEVVESMPYETDQLASAQIGTYGLFFSGGGNAKGCAYTLIDAE